jgi:hypothetical protein
VCKKTGANPFGADRPSAVRMVALVPIVPSVWPEGLQEKKKNLLPGTYDQKMTLLIFISFLKITGQTGQRPKIARKYWGILVPFSPSAAISRRDNRTTAVDVIGDKVDQAQVDQAQKAEWQGKKA